MDITVQGASYTAQLPDASKIAALGSPGCTSAVADDGVTADVASDTIELQVWYQAPVFETYTYTASAENVNFFTDAGSPTSGNWKIVINSGVILWSASIYFAAAATGVFPDLLWIVNNGGIRGAGGSALAVGSSLGGGKGGGVAYHGAPGGGGAGIVGGLGFENVFATSGEDGTATAGGAGGTSAGTTNTHAHVQQYGEPGGPALQLNMRTIIENENGTIWGGGGAGGGYVGHPSVGGAGGDPGEQGGGGTGASYYGAGGKAVDLQGNEVVWISGSGAPNVKVVVS